MKVILAGSTGFIGREVLEQCVQNSSITSIVALSRRELPTSSVSSSPKVKVVIINDYLSYSESVLQDIKGADACIWSLGKAWISDNEIARKVSIDYTIAAVEAFTQNRSRPEDGNRKFRFVYLSGAAAEKDPTKSLLWLMRDYRRIRGQVENKLLAYAQEHQKSFFEAYIMRPGLVLAKETSFMDFFRSMAPSVKMDKLVGLMVKTALDGTDKQIFENSDINQFDK